MIGDSLVDFGEILMKELDIDEHFQIRINKDERADVYLSCSWRPDAGQDILWLLVKELDQARIRVVGDVPDLPEQDDNRIERIMRACSGFVVVLPFRKDSHSLTSPYMIREIRIAASLNIPIILFKESRVPVILNSSPEEPRISFSSHSSEIPITVGSIPFFGPVDYDEGTKKGFNEVSGKLMDFIDCVTQKPQDYQPYAFLNSRLQRDFQMVREAIIAAVENTAGVPCLWFDDDRYKTNIMGVRERTRLLIKHASFLVADLTFSPQNPEHDNPNRSHEIGMAVAYRRQIILCSQDPRRDPYFSAGDMQIIFWKNEEELNRELTKWIKNNKENLARRVYNWELPGRDHGYEPKITQVRFNFNQSRRFIAPNLYPLKGFDSWFVAFGFGLIALSLSLIIKQLIGFDQMFDFASILAGIFTVVFASDISRGIRLTLGQNKFLRYVIPLIGLMLLLLWLGLKFYQSPSASAKTVLIPE